MCVLLTSNLTFFNKITLFTSKKVVNSSKGRKQVETRLTSLSETQNDCCAHVMPKNGYTIDLVILQKETPRGKFPALTSGYYWTNLYVLPTLFETYPEKKL